MTDFLEGEGYRQKSTDSICYTDRLSTQRNTKSFKRVRSELTLNFFLCIFCMVCTNVHGLNSISKPEVKMSAKKIFINELNEARSGNPILSNKNPQNLDILLNNMINDNPTPNPSSTASLLKFSKGEWGVVYAPHIKTLGKILLSDFSVFYTFYDINDTDKQGITSNVMYDSKVFGKGWLNTQGNPTFPYVSVSICLSIYQSIYFLIYQSTPFYLATININHLSIHYQYPLLILTIAKY